MPTTSTELSRRKTLGLLGLGLASTALPVLFGIPMTVGCQDASSSRALSGEFICSTPFLHDLIAHIGKATRIRSSSLMGSGVDPHLYRPTASDVAAIMSARAIFVVGLGLEGKMGETLARASDRGLPVIAVGDVINKSELFSAHEQNPDATHAVWDPHIWMDPAIWSQCATFASAEIINAAKMTDSKIQALVFAQAELYQRELAALRVWGIERAASIPKERRVIITSHDAFRYFGRAFGFEVHGIQGVSTESEAGLADVRRLVDLIVERSIPAVFAESSVANKSVTALIEGAAARGHTVTLGGTLFSDSLGPARTYEGTYLGMIDHDLTTIVSALGGEVHPYGRLGALAASTESST
ncbi:MAG: zinc ABC transporter substrate-binding protein [Planctomycetota bacterium]|nr:zinc ABC transporter substrate-binding protein [Planctomycetota bacterium]